MRVKPHPIATRRRRELPQNRCLAPTLRVALEVMLKEPRTQPRPHVVILRVQQRLSLLPKFIGGSTEDLAEDCSHRGREVAPMTWVVHQNPVSGRRQRIATRSGGQRQAVIASQHRGRTHWQRIKRPRLKRQRPSARRKTNIKPPKRHTNSP